MLKLIFLLSLMLFVLIIYEVIHRYYSKKELKKQLSELSNQSEGVDIVKFRKKIR